VLALGACGDDSTHGTMPDAAATGPCNLGAPFGPRMPLASLNTHGEEEFPRLTADQLVIVFSRDKTLWMATRASATAPFDPATPIPGRPTPPPGWAPSLSSDGLTLYFSSAPGASSQVFVTHRSDRAADFPPETPVALGSGGSEAHPFLLADQSELWFVSASGAGQFQIWRGVFGAGGAIKSMKVAELAGNWIDWAPTLTADALAIYFASSRGNTGNYDIYAARRATRADAFGVPEVVPEITTPGSLGRDIPGWITPDGCRIYLANAGNSADMDLFYADRPR
jgi:Tol biopolymer transport system component